MKTLNQHLKGKKKKPIDLMSYAADIRTPPKQSLKKGIEQIAIQLGKKKIEENDSTAVNSIATGTIDPKDVKIDLRKKKKEKKVMMYASRICQERS